MIPSPPRGYDPRLIEKVGDLFVRNSRMDCYSNTNYCFLSAIGSKQLLYVYLI